MLRWALRPVPPNSRRSRRSHLTPLRVFLPVPRHRNPGLVRDSVTFPVFFPRPDFRLSELFFEHYAQHVLLDPIVLIIIQELVRLSGLPEDDRQFSRSCLLRISRGDLCRPPELRGICLLSEWIMREDDGRCKRTDFVMPVGLPLQEIIQTPSRATSKALQNVRREAQHLNSHTLL